MELDQGPSLPVQSCGVVDVGAHDHAVLLVVAGILGVAGEKGGTGLADAKG